MSKGLLASPIVRAAPHRRRADAVLGRFQQDAGGSMAVEFGLLAPLVFALFALVFELSWRYYVQSQAENAVAAVAERLADPATRISDVDGVKAAICAQARALTCSNANRLQVQVVEFTATSPARSQEVQDRIAIAPGRPNVVRVVQRGASLVPDGLMRTIGVSAASVSVVVAFVAR